MSRALRYILQWYTNPARFLRRPARPTCINLPITDNCNARCVMCDVWKTRSYDEITPEELGRILRDPLFRNVQHVGVSGGEPTLRKDLCECVEAIMAGLPRIRTFTITSHGFQFRRWETFLPTIARTCREHGVDFRLNLSLDGIGPVHDTVRGIPGAFRPHHADVCVGRA